MPSFRIDEAYLIGGWCAAALWGLFSCLLIFALVQLAQLHAKGKMNRSKWITATAMVVLYCLSTTHISLALRRLIKGFVILQGPDTVPYFTDIGQPLNRAKDLVYITSMVIADSVVVWRCYAVWGGDKRVIALPIVMILGTIAAGYGAISQYFLTNPDPQQAINFGTAMFSVSLTTNVLVTGLTVGRIWWKARSLSRTLGRAYHTDTYKTLLLLLIESGLVIAVAKLFEFTLFEVANGEFNALYIVFDMIPQINGIMPTLIIITVNARITITDEQSNAALSTLRVGPMSHSHTSSAGVTASSNRPQWGPPMDSRDVFVTYKSERRGLSGDVLPLEAMGPMTREDGDSKV